MDFVTFVGEGEPTLCKSIGCLIRKAKELTDCPVAVDTNGSLLHIAAVREALLHADVVMPSLDAGTAATYRKINRPHREFNFATVVDGMRKFRREYKGEMWIEHMLVKGLNDSESELESLKKVFNQIEPDKIHINVPVRPPAEPRVVPPDKEAIALAYTILRDVTDISTEEYGDFFALASTSAEEAILPIIRRLAKLLTYILTSYVASSKYSSIPCSFAYNSISTCLILVLTV